MDYIKDLFVYILCICIEGSIYSDTVYIYEVHEGQVLSNGELIDYRPPAISGNSILNMGVAWHRYRVSDINRA